MTASRFHQPPDRPIPAHGAEFLEWKRGWTRPVVLETVRTFMACRTPALGCHLYVCPGSTTPAEHSRDAIQHSAAIWFDG